jgi:hypothetical protein
MYFLCFACSITSKNPVTAGWRTLITFKVSSVNGLKQPLEIKGNSLIRISTFGIAINQLLFKAVIPNIYIINQEHRNKSYDG